MVPNLTGNDLNPKERMLYYISTNRGCTKSTACKNSGVSLKPAKRILKELINEKKVAYFVDENNPRVHHLYIVDEEIFALKNLEPIISKIKNRIKRQIYTKVQVIGGGEDGEWVSCPTYGPDWNNDIIEDMARLVIGPRPLFLNTGIALMDR